MKYMHVTDICSTSRERRTHSCMTRYRWDVLSKMSSNETMLGCLILRKINIIVKHAYCQMVTRWHSCCIIQIQRISFFPFPSIFLGSIPSEYTDKIPKIKPSRASDGWTTFCWEWQWMVNKEEHLTASLLTVQMCHSHTKTHQTVFYCYIAAKCQSSISSGSRVELRAYEHAITLTQQQLRRANVIFIGMSESLFFYDCASTFFISALITLYLTLY